MVEIAPEVASLVRVGMVHAEDLVVRDRDERLGMEIDGVGARLREQFSGREPSQIEALQPARTLYRNIGVDPTKLRPSSEALLRRVLKGQEFPRINTLVDVNNLCSLEWLLPIGLHDLDRTRGKLVLRRGMAGEGYDAIGKGWYSVEARLTVADEVGPCGSPTSDSQRTMITGQTTRALMVIYAPASFSRDDLARHLQVASSRITTYCDGRIVGTAVLPTVG